MRAGMNFFYRIKIFYLEVRDQICALVDLIRVHYNNKKKLRWYREVYTCLSLPKPILPGTLRPKRQKRDVKSISKNGQA